MGRTVRTLVIGGGGREHAVVHQILTTDPVAEVIAAPGNPGIALMCPTFAVEVTDAVGLAELAVREGVDVAIIGPEVALAAGVADRLRDAGVAVLGPGATGAQIETSKSWAKDLMQGAGIPTAVAARFTDSASALAHLATAPFPLVVKADGLAAGKGAVVCHSLEVAERAVREMLDESIFGEAGSLVLIEEFLVGDEYSMMVFTDGESLIPMPLSQDHKPWGDGDTGPNTGGMGAYAPVRGIEGASELSLERIFVPLLAALKSAGIDYRGVVTGNLIWTSRGPYVIEFNARFGDPEAEVTLPLLRSDLREITVAAHERRLASVAAEWSSDVAVCVVMTSHGYPGSPRSGDVIEGVESAGEVATVFYSGAARRGDELVTSGGRVLVVTGVAESFEQAKARAYEGVGRISFPGAYFRSDIGFRPNATQLAEA